MESFTEEPSWFIVILGMVICWAPVAPADAAGSLQPGCDKLAAAVTDSVAQAFDEPPARSYGPAGSSGAAGTPEPAVRCATVTATTSRAFMRALRVRGLAAGWQGAAALQPGVAAEAGDYCPGQLLDRCAPRLAGSGTALGDAGADRVAQAWAAVRAALGQVMPLGPHSDMAWFRESSLRAALRPGAAAPRR